MSVVNVSKTKITTVICFGDGSGSVLLKSMEAKIMQIKIGITINRQKRDAVRLRMKEHGIVPSVVTVYGILRLLDVLDGNRVSRIDRNFVNMAIREYKPFKYEVDPCNTTISFPDYVATRTELVNRFSVHGYRLAPIIKAFYNVLLKCDINSIPVRDQTNGFLLAKISPRRVLTLKNQPLSNGINISSEVLESLKIIADQNETSVYRMMMRAVETLIKIEFDRDAFIENSDIIRENILMYNKKIIGMAGTASIRLNASGLKKGIQVLVLLEKYGIPGLAELFHRIARFILLSHSGQIQLTRIHVNDTSDYNETRMIRNEYRKEVQYATSR